MYAQPLYDSPPSYSPASSSSTSPSTSPSAPSTFYPNPYDTGSQPPSRQPTLGGADDSTDVDADETDTLRTVMLAALALAREAVRLDSGDESRAALDKYVASTELLREALERMQRGESHGPGAGAGGDEGQGTGTGKGKGHPHWEEAKIKSIMPGAPIGLPTGPPPINRASHPGYNPGPGYGSNYPPPPMPPRSPVSPHAPGYQPSYLPQPALFGQPQFHPPSGPPPPLQPQPQSGYYPPPMGPPPPLSPSHTQSSYYAPPPGPPPGHAGASYPPPPPMNQYGNGPQYGGAPQGNALMYLGAPVSDPLAPPGAQAPMVPGYDPGADAEAVRRAVKGFGTDEGLLIATLVPLSAPKMAAVAQRYMSMTGKNIVDVLDSETSGYFKMGLHGLSLGPLGWDVELIRGAIAGIGSTKEQVLTELLLARPAAELRLLATAYRQRYGRDLLQDVRGDLSGKTERMFVMALNANPPPEWAPVDHAAVARDVEALYKAGEGKVGTDEMVFCDVLINRSQAHLSAVIELYGRQHRSLYRVVKKEFSGHMRDGLLFIVAGAKPKRDKTGAWRDAKLIDKAMVGFGTRDEDLVRRIIRAHWDPARMDAVRRAYQARTKKALEGRVAGETSGAYKKLMVAVVGSSVR
ncbi:hypothetical protein H0H81_008553 [Sphagnurus paluster]|uniref:Annexin n=1 Tax=Sphagnurus paluster TaxID=117069 RepID=A0A9P7GMY4_9AGAR|nr:hypothetical protein H0H81_008553 [Sphagnurus paluster]